MNCNKQHLCTIWGNLSLILIFCNKPHAKSGYSLLYLVELQTKVKRRTVNSHLAECLNSVLNVKVLVGVFNQLKPLS